MENSISDKLQFNPGLHKSRAQQGNKISYCVS